MKWMAVSLFVVALVLAAVFALAQRPPRERKADPSNGRSYLEKHGIEVRASAATDEPGRDWAWVEKRLSDIGEPPWTRHVRRKAWPIMFVKAGTKLEIADGMRETVKVGWTKEWRIWRQSDVGDQSTFIGGLCQGWGGSLGADHEVDDFVMVGGEREFDGTGYRPSAEDLAATDWEPIRDEAV